MVVAQQRFGGRVGWLGGVMEGYGVGLVIERSRVRLPARVLPGSVG